MKLVTWKLAASRVWVAQAPPLTLAPLTHWLAAFWAVTEAIADWISMS